MQRVLAGRVVEAGLRRAAEAQGGVAKGGVAKGAAAGEHPRGRGHFLRREEVVVRRRVLKRVRVIVRQVSVSMLRRIGGLVAAEAGGGGRRRGRTQGQGGARSAQGE